MVVAPGSPCPSFSIEAAVSGRTLSPDALAGRRAVLVFHGPKTTDAPKEVGKAVRAAWPSADDVVVCNVVDLRKMGGLWQKVANAQLKATYERMGAKLEAAGQDPSDYVVLCPDWDGAVCTAFGVAAPDEQAAVVVLDADGKVVAVAEGAGLGEAAVAALST